jgi:hypothetical protein
VNRARQVLPPSSNPPTCTTVPLVVCTAVSAARGGRVVLWAECRDGGAGFVWSWAAAAAVANIKAKGNRYSTDWCRDTLRQIQGQFL